MKEDIEISGFQGKGIISARPASLVVEDDDCSPPSPARRSPLDRLQRNVRTSVQQVTETQGDTLPIGTSHSSASVSRHLQYYGAGIQNICGYANGYASDEPKERTPLAQPIKLIYSANSKTKQLLMTPEPGRMTPPTSFLMPDDENIAHLQVKELEKKVSNLAHKLHVSQEECSRLRKSLEDETLSWEEEKKRGSNLCSSMESQVIERAEEVQRLLQEVLHLRQVVTEYECREFSRRLDEQKKKAFDLLSMTCKKTTSEMRVSFFTADKVHRRHVKSRMLWRWRLSASLDLCILSKYARANVVRLECFTPLQGAIFLAQCGQSRIIKHGQGIVNKLRFQGMISRWRSYVMEQRDVRKDQLSALKKLNLVKNKMLRVEGALKRLVFTAWHVSLTDRERKYVQASNLYRRVYCRNARYYMDAWKAQHQALLRLETACDKFLRLLIRRLAKSCVRLWKERAAKYRAWCSISRRLFHQRSRRLAETCARLWQECAAGNRAWRDTSLRLTRHLSRRLLHRCMHRWSLCVCVRADRIAVKLLDSKSTAFPLLPRLALARSASRAWRRLGRCKGPEGKPGLWRALNIGHKYLNAFVAAALSRRFVLVFRGWRLQGKLRVYAETSVQRRAWECWKDLEEYLLGKRRMHHTEDLVARRTEQGLKYRFLARWYHLLVSRFRKVLSLAKQYFGAWSDVSKAEAAARDRKGQALLWVSQRSLALRTLLAWVFRGSRARSLHLARRWISRAFYRWVSSTFNLRARISLPGTLRRAESVLEKILFT